MKYGILFLILSATFLLYSFKVSKINWLLIWSSLSFLYVSLCYLNVLPGFYKKEGRIPIWNKVLNAPYLLITLLTWHIYKFCIKEAPFNQIDDFLFIGRRVLSYEFEIESIDFFIDLTSEFDEISKFRSSEKYINFPIKDAGVPEIEDLIKLLKKVNGKKVFVHCAQGHGRTGLVAISLLLSEGKVKNINEALTQLQNKRPALGLNKQQLLFLADNLEILIQANE